MRIILAYGSLAIFFGVGIISCDSDASLESWIEDELSTGLSHDSLFLGVHFGMERQEFYDHCWEMNRKGIVKEGPNNMSVEYMIQDSLGRPIAFNFYPEFDQGNTAHRYRTRFYYYGWAPWNKELWSDNLLNVLQSVFVEWYGGNEFRSHRSEDGTERYYKIDGNRAIELYKSDDQMVLVYFHDLSHNQEL